MQPTRSWRSRITKGLLACAIAWCGPTVSAQDAAPVIGKFQSATPTPRLEHWQRRLATIQQELQPDPSLGQIRLVFVGDSITDFWLFTSSPWVPAHRYGRRIWNESFATPGSENFAYNLGISGDRLEHVLYRLQPRAQGGLGQLDAPQLQPEYFVVMIGINNTWAAETPVVDSVLQGIHAVLLQLHTLKPAARLLVQTLLPTNDPLKNQQVVLPINTQLMSLVQQMPMAAQIDVLDLYPAFVDAQGLQLPQLFTDGLHPSESGYQVWRDRLLPHLARLRTAQRGKNSP